MSGHSPEFIDSEFTVSTNDANKVATVKAAIAANDHVFVFIYMDGCGHCVAAEAAWVKFTSEANNRPNVAAFAVSNAMMEEFKTEPEPALGEVETKNVLGDAPAGFPTFRYVHNSNEIDYNGGRSVLELIQWMDGATPSRVGEKKYTKKNRPDRHSHSRKSHGGSTKGGGRRKRRKARKTRKSRKTRKTRKTKRRR
jgi:hypothetical protein